MGSKSPQRLHPIQLLVAHQYSSEVEALRMAAPLLADCGEPAPISGDESALKPILSDGWIHESDDQPAGRSLARR